jgi:hypothetical protein
LAKPLLLVESHCTIYPQPLLVDIHSVSQPGSLKLKGSLHDSLAYNLHNCLGIACQQLRLRRCPSDRLDPLTSQRDQLAARYQCSKNLRSQLAQSAEAQQALAQLRADMPLVIPPGADLIAIASQMDVAHLKSLEQMAVPIGKQTWDLEAIAQSVGGSVDSIGGLNCVLVGNEVIVAVDQNVLGVLSPADRQSTARWIKDYQAGKSGSVSDFVRAAADRARLPDSAAITWSLELKDAFAPIAFRRAAIRSSVLSKRKQDPKAVADLCSSINGVTLSIDVTDRLSGKLDFGFGQDFALKGFEKELAIELTGSGCMLDEFENWTGGVQGNDVVLAGNLQEPSIRKVFNLLGIHDPQSGMKVALEQTAAPSLLLVLARNST